MRFKLYILVISILNILILPAYSNEEIRAIDYGNFLIGFAEPYGASRFLDAAIAEGGKTGIFTYNRYIYQPASGWNAFPNGGIPRKLADLFYIATYDLATQRVKIIYKHNNLHGKWTPGQGQIGIVATFDDKILVRQSGQFRKDLSLQTNLYWLNIRSGDLTLLLLEEELTKLNLGLGHLYLVDNRGTLILVCPTLEYKKEHPNWYRHDMPKTLLVCYPSGKIKKIASIISYYGFKDDVAHYYSTNRKYEVFNVSTGEYKLGEKNGYAKVTNNTWEMRGLNISFSIHYDNGHKLKIGKKANGKWKHSILELTPQRLSPLPELD